MSVSATSEFKNVEIEQHEGVTTLRVSRPQVLNALNRETIGEIETATQHFLANDQAEVMIVTGAGEKSFVSGADINELAALDARAAEEASQFGQRVFLAIERSKKPVIAAINGYAFGGGFELALACHIRIASDNAVMGLPEVGLAIIPGYGGTQRLPRLVGPGRAHELILSGRRIKADEAERWGIVNRVVPQAELLGAARDLAQSIRKNGPLAVTAGLEAIRSAADLTLEAGLRLESGLFGMLAASDDMHEGMKAFLEKRPPRFERK